MSDNDPGPVPDEGEPLPAGLAAITEMYDDAVAKITLARLNDPAFESHCRMTFEALRRMGHCAPDALAARVQPTAEALMLAVWKLLGGQDKRMAFSMLTTIQLTARLVAAVYEEESHTLEIPAPPPSPSC